MSIDLRLASATDEDLILRLVRAYHEFEDIRLTDAQRAAAVQALLGDRERGAIWLVLRGELAVGYIALCFGYSIEFAGRDAFVDEFYILPEHRGQGLGLGALKRIKDEARKQGVKALHLEVARANSRARKLYSRVDFEAREKYVLMSVAL